MADRRTSKMRARGRTSRRTGSLFLLIGLLSGVFASQAFAASVTTGSAESYTSATATLSGTVNTSGKPTFYGFEYGPTTAYGSETAGDFAESGSLGYQQDIDGLEPSTTYHYRAVAASLISGNFVYAYGSDKTFSTPAVHRPRFEAESYTASVSGSQDESDPHEIDLGIRTLSCSTVGFSKEVTAASHELMVTPSYSGCTASGGMAAKINRKSCRYTFDLDPVDPPYTGSVDITCLTKGDEIEVRIYTSKAKEEADEAGCVIKVAPQGGIGSTEFATVGKGATRGVSSVFDLSGISYSITGSALLCGKSGSDGTYTGSSTLTASAGGSPTGFFVAGEQVVGTYLTGKESAEPASQPRIEGEAYPLDLSGGQDPGAAHSIKLGIRTVTCSSSDLSGELTGATAAIPLAAEYTGCTASPGSLPVKVETNSCNYVLHVLNAGPPYAGSFDVSCSEGDTIEFNVYGSKTAEEEGKTLCVLAVGAQTGLTGIGLETVGSGPERGIGIDLGLSGIQYTTTGSKLACGASASNGTYAGGSSLFAF